MISIASNYVADDDDAHKSLKASAIQNSGQWNNNNNNNNNKRKSVPEEQHTPDLVASSPTTSPTCLKEKLKNTATTMESTLTFHPWHIHSPMDKLSGPMD
jgi:hypothetical protein